MPRIQKRTTERRYALGRGFSTLTATGQGRIMAPGTVPFHWRKRLIFSAHTPNWAVKLVWVMRVGVPREQRNARDSQEDHRETSSPGGDTRRCRISAGTRINTLSGPSTGSQVSESSKFRNYSTHRRNPETNSAVQNKDPQGNAQGP